MRILVVGAGALGGYFGARLVEAGRDVTFLVRPARAAQLADGLIIHSPKGGLRISPTIAEAYDLHQHFDLILLGCKAYDLESAMTSFAPAVGDNSTILPLLNGIAHIEKLNRRFGKERVVGGRCAIGATVRDGQIYHLGKLDSIRFGEQDNHSSARVSAILETFSGAKFDFEDSVSILHDMWEKWIFIATLAGITCLLRSSIGDIISSGGGDLTLSLFEECAAIAKSQGYPLRQHASARMSAMLSAPGSLDTASMLRDIENNGRIEADDIIGDLLRLESNLSKLSLLRIAHAHLKAYEQRRQREGGR